MNLRTTLQLLRGSHENFTISRIHWFFHHLDFQLSDISFKTTDHNNQGWQGMKAILFENFFFLESGLIY